MRSLAACVAATGAVAQCPVRSPCCPDCVSNLYCPANNGCYAEDQAGCPGKRCLPYEGASRLGSFIVIGDFGHDPTVHGDISTQQCQNKVAEAMDQQIAQLGDVKFVINVGDSFYPDGVSSKGDAQWDSKWRNIYSDQVRSVPWYSVYGNHDYHIDPAACSDNAADGAQINGNINDRNQFYMPDYSWSIEHPELQLEVIAMDTNNYMDGWNTKLPSPQQKFFDCQYTPCQAACEARMRARSNAAFDLWRQRRAASAQKNLVVFSHYPTDYFWDNSSSDASKDFLAELSDPSKHVEYFGGHRHNVDQSSTLSIAPNNNWVSGGGGGWSCDGQQQGFVVAEIQEDGSISTRAVLVPASECCNKLVSNATVADKVYV